MSPHADETAAAYRAALLAAFDGPIPDDCHAALGCMERAARARALTRATEAETRSLRTVLRRTAARLRAVPDDAGRAAFARLWSTYRCAMAQHRMLRLADACAERAEVLARRRLR